jgi:hypothetical protein
MSTLVLAVFVTPLAAWLANKGMWWLFYGDAEKACSRPANHERRVAEWQERVDELLLQLDYYLANPNWLDLAYERLEGVGAL